MCVKSDHLARVKPPEESGKENLLVCVEEETGAGARTVSWNPRALGTGSPGEVSDIKADFLPCREEHRQNSADWLTGCWESPGQTWGATGQSPPGSPH